MGKQIDFPPHLIQLDNYFILHGMQLYLVGGAIRDFFLKKEKPHDFDLEVRSFDLNILAEDWPNYLQQVIEGLESEGYFCQKLSFSVYRLKHKIFGEIELSSARIEEYPDITRSSYPYGHSDFKAKAVGTLDDLTAMRRRDFTINALAICLFDGRLHDPYGGMIDLKKKILHPCGGENFFKDPVRLLRLIRFEIKLGFRRSDFIVSNLSKFNLTKITPYYLAYEAFKVNPLTFFRHLLECEGVLFPDFILNLRPLQKMKLSISTFDDIKNMSDFVFYLALVLDLTEDNKTFIKNLCDSFSVPQKLLLNFLELRKEIEVLRNLNKSFFIKLAKEDIVTFCQDSRCALLLRFFGRLRNSNLADKLKKYFPQEFSQLIWIFDLLPLPDFNKNLGLKYLKDQKRYWSIIPLYLRFIAIPEI